MTIVAIHRTCIIIHIRYMVYYKGGAMRHRWLSILAIMPVSVSAQTLPVWTKPLPYGELECETVVSRGMKWDEIKELYVTAKYRPRIFTIQRLDTNDSGYSKYGCKPSERPEDRSGKRSYTRSFYYRYDNVANALGWLQGWCEEKYTIRGPVYVTYENDPNFRPKIGFTPRGHFYSYGAQHHFLKPENPKFSRINTEAGTCKVFKNEYKKRFKFAGRDIYYAPEN